MGPGGGPGGMLGVGRGVGPDGGPGGWPSEGPSAGPGGEPNKDSKMSTKHVFSKSLSKGNVGEQELLRLFSGLTKANGRTGDLWLGDKKVELKTDYYSTATSANFFLERWSDIEKQKVGGPWQAAQHECTYFVYYFIDSKAGWVFDTTQLLKELEQMSSLKPVEIKNVRWTTVGFKVPRSAVKSLFTWTGVPAQLLAGDAALFELFKGK